LNIFIFDCYQPAIAIKTGVSCYQWCIR